MIIDTYSDGPVSRSLELVDIARTDAMGLELIDVDDSIVVLDATMSIQRQWNLGGN